MVEDLVWPRDDDDSSTSYWSATGLTQLEAYFGPLATTIAEHRPEHRLVRDAVEVLREPKAAVAWLDGQEQLFGRLLERTERCRNAVIHGQRPSLGALKTVDGFIRDLGRLVAQESMRSAQTEQVPLVELERWRNELADQRLRFEAGHRPLDVWFADE
ncbi:hypothetical protein [Patulibacter sp. SYSU D01012]|uniref:hypothetical protein n=1 Tax=Patulibacter sp. SYSU D01012 TaxID=2817381 RepID=UPI001B307943|nr:hypothetical protein [Patulibacter sp. SYSU D01012]